MNLTERAEIRKETFYKLTNSAEAPDVPSGNRNLLLYSADPWQAPQTGYYQFFGTAKTSETYNGAVVYKTGGAWNRLGINLNNHLVERGLLKVGDVLTYSVLAKTDQETPIQSRLFVRYNNQSGTENISGKNEIINLTNEWQKVSVTFTVTEKMLSEDHRVNYLGWEQTTNSESGKYVYYTCNKIERGNVATPYSQAPEDFWSTTTLVPTQQQRYLWKFEYVYYSDGSVEITQPVNISIAGADGTNGQTSHVHFAFADNATGGGFSLTTPKAYMGWYADFNEAASTDPTKYRWSKWKGDQGLPGKPGADGKTSYFHMAYADSADGRTGFSFKESGQQYQGYYTDFVQANSTDPTKYTWMDRRAGVEVGGKNLLLYTADPWKAPNDYYQFNGATKTDEMLNGSVVYKTRSIWSRLAMNWGKQLIDKPDVKVGDEYTYSVYVRTDQESPIKARLFFRYSGQSSAEVMTGEKLITQEWQRFTKTFTVTQKMLSDSSKLNWVGFEQTSNSEDGKFVYYACNMLEEGNIPTPWQPALEDIQADIDSKADQTLTQEQLNALAEKNNLIKAEMEAKASIDTVDKWITAYENYVKANDADKAKSEQALKEASERILGMRYEVNDLKFAWDAIDRFMSFQNEGLIIGKKDGSAYAKFSDDRISLFSGSSEVMYISQGTLNIANGIFTKTIQIGRFRFETHPADADMLVLRYLGG